ncbi:unnamed protein product [Microthlaspi erraticum]|uniref:Uncharacterized protein n=1 Tax=Microthlaspi erraticum TaxID=1685480 RepID=A0A6D2KZ61_9BRAS|nr:unnamed protein product [Microthlaspi erraticum]
MVSEHNRYRGGGRNNFPFGNPPFPYWASPNVWPGPFGPWPNQFANWTPNSQMPTYRGPHVNPATRPVTNNSQQAHLVEIQPTTLPQVYTTKTLPDPNGADWYMDTGATAHLSATAGSSNPENTAPM